MAAVMLETSGSAGSRQTVNNGNNGWSTLGRSSRRQQQQSSSSSSFHSTNKSTLTLRSRSRSRSRSAALHCLAVPEPSDEEQEDCYCYADWHQQESYQPALVVWTPGLNHPSSTPIKTATLRSALRSSITNYGD